MSNINIKKRYIKNNINMLSVENKKEILSLVIREDGMNSVREDRAFGVSIDLDKITHLNVIDSIYDIIKKRKISIQI